jgi:hypothetical protein
MILTMVVNDSLGLFDTWDMGEPARTEMLAGQLIAFRERRLPANGCQSDLIESMRLHEFQTDITGVRNRS